MNLIPSDYEDGESKHTRDFLLSTFRYLSFGESSFSLQHNRVQKQWEGKQAKIFQEEGRAWPHVAR